MGSIVAKVMSSGSRQQTSDTEKESGRERKRGKGCKSTIVNVNTFDIFNIKHIYLRAEKIPGKLISKLHSGK